MHEKKWKMARKKFPEHYADCTENREIEKLLLLLLQQGIYYDNGNRKKYNT